MICLNHPCYAVLYLLRHQNKNHVAMNVKAAAEQALNMIIFT
jgi:hypothetical protein